MNLIRPKRALHFCKSQLEHGLSTPSTVIDNVRWKTKTKTTSRYCSAFLLSVTTYQYHRGCHMPIICTSNYQVDQSVWIRGVVLGAHEFAASTARGSITVTCTMLVWTT